MFVYKSNKKDTPKDPAISKQPKTLDTKNTFHNEHVYPVSPEMTQGYYAVSPAPETLASNNCSVVQRYLILGDWDITKDYYEYKKMHDDTIEKDLDQFVTNIAKEMLGQINPKITSETDESMLEYLNYLQESIINDPQSRLRKQLKKWIQDDVGDKTNSKNQIFGQKFQPRVYRDYYDLAVALIGWVDAKENRHREKEIAKAAMKDKAVNFHLDSVFLRIKTFIDNNRQQYAEIESEIKNPEGGIIVYIDEPEHKPKKWAIYKSYFDSKSKKEMPLAESKKEVPLPESKKEVPLAESEKEMQLPNHWEVLENPYKHNIRQKTGVLHDLMHYFFEKFGDSFLFYKLPQFQATTLRGRENYNRPQNSQIRGDRELVKKGEGSLEEVKYSDEEQDGSYQYARRNHLPMYGRHSYSAARMMGLAKQVNALPQEISAISWAIMAYWRIHYDHTSIPYHTTHEIMDFTPEFGLEYIPEEYLAGFDKMRKDGFLKFLLQNAQGDLRMRQALMSYHNNDLDRVSFFLDHSSAWVIPDVMNYLRTTVLPFAEFKQLPIDKLRMFFEDNEENKQLFKRLPLERQNYIYQNNSVVLCKKR